MCLLVIHVKCFTQISLTFFAIPGGTMIDKTWGNFINDNYQMIIIKLSGLQLSSKCDEVMGAEQTKMSFLQIYLPGKGNDCYASVTLI